MDKQINTLAQTAIALLKKLIETPSFSKEEDATAAIIADFLAHHGVKTNRKQNNVWAVNEHFDAEKPTILLNSHHDTVRPNHGYTRDPFAPDIEDGKLFGLGSNDAGGALVCLAVVFLRNYAVKDLPYNLIFAATAEEEISGKNGIELLLPELGKIDGAIVGEPTKMEMAIAERGLMVIDGVAVGRSGHAAREEGENALYIALDDINWIRNYRFPNVSEILGAVKMSVTVINAGTQHNVVPDRCLFTIDVRVNELYALKEVLETIKSHTKSELKCRSMRLRSSLISLKHPIVKAGLALQKNYYGSPTTSDKALMPFPALKMGPGDSARSHTADEFIYLQEIENGVNDYLKLLDLVYWDK